MKVTGEERTNGSLIKQYTIICALLYITLHQSLVLCLDFIWPILTHQLCAKLESTEEQTNIVGFGTLNNV